MLSFRGKSEKASVYFQIPGVIRLTASGERSEAVAGGSQT